MSQLPADSPQRGEVLVAIMNAKADWGILQEQGWYRIPLAKAPKRWPPRWLAFYQTKVFGDEAYAINHYGLVRDIQIVPRRALFPNELQNAKTDNLYYQIHLNSLERLASPIRSRRWRRIVFIPTTWHKFSHASEVNDLFDESPLEDHLWTELKRLQLAAERQWAVVLTSGWYFLDFALFCANGQVDVETDGDMWHSVRARIPEDNRRDNALQAAGWHVLRFNGHQIAESLKDYCVPRIAETINTLGGLSDQGVVPRLLYPGPQGTAQQLSLLEEPTDYDLE